MILPLALVLAGSIGGTVGPDHAFDYDPTPALLWIPVEDVTLVPSSDCPISQMGANNSGLLCSFLVSQDTLFQPIANIDAVVAGVAAALQPFGVVVTTTRPPPFVPFHLIIPTEDVQMGVSSYTCTLAPTNCDGTSRNEIGFTFAETSNCMAPDQIQATLVAYGRMSGLEGTNDPDDVMDFQPSFMPPAVSYLDACSPMPETPLCVGAIHASYCGGTPDVQNSHQELLGVYGPAPAVPDTTPPSIDALAVPDEGENLPTGAQLVVSATVSDDSGFAFLRWTVQSDAIIDFPGVADDGTIGKCTNRACVLDYDGMPYPALDQPFVFDELVGLPDGDYALVLEVRDLAGNAAEPVMRTFTVGRVATDESGSGSGSTSGDGTSDDGSTSTFTTSDGHPPDATSVTTTATGTDGAGTPTDTGGDADAGSVDDDGKGCGCREAAPPHAMLALLLMVGRRRRQGPATRPRWNRRTSACRSG